LSTRRKPNLVRVYADESGETHLADLDVPGPPQETYGGVMAHVLHDVPTTTLHVTQLLARRPRLDLHPPPRRQLVIFLRGEIEITTTDGDRRRFGPGDALLAEDMVGKGHYHQDVGDELAMSVAIGIPDDWTWPGT
jgi:hypothetical protein